MDGDVQTTPNVSVRVIKPLEGKVSQVATLHFLLRFPVPWVGFKDWSDDIDEHQLEVGQTFAKESGQWHVRQLQHAINGIVDIYSYLV